MTAHHAVITMHTTSPLVAPQATAALPAAHTPPIIADRGEFIDALQSLSQGHVLVRTGDAAGDCVLDGAIVYRSYATLERYGLIREFHNPQGFANARYFRITPSGRAFADRACRAWRSQPLWQRLAVRFTG